MQTGEDILFTAPGPDPIPTATTEIVGTPGNALNVYWLVSHFPIGSVVSGPFPQKDSPNVLDDENYVHISWLPTLGASSYDLLFTKELELPQQPGRFLLAGNLTQTEFRDTGQGLSFYDVAGIPLGAPQQEHIFFDNRDFEQPTLRFIPWPIQVSSIIFEDGSSQNTAGGGGLPAPPDRSVQFNDNNRAFGGSQNLTWDEDDATLRINGSYYSQINLRFGGSDLGYITAQNGVMGIQSLGSIYLVASGVGSGVGININPQFQLDVLGDINITNPEGSSFAYRINGNQLVLGDEGPGTGGLIGWNGAQLKLADLTSGSPIDRLTISGTGRVDINTSITDNTRMLTVGNPYAGLWFGGDYTGFWIDSPSFPLIFKTLGVEHMRIDSVGNIEMANLPNTDPGAGSKRIWYDPSDGNRVKFSP